MKKFNFSFLCFAPGYFNRSKRFLILTTFYIVLGLSFLTDSINASPETNSNELRGIWISDTTSFKWEEVIQDIKKAGFNNIFVNLASAGVAFYPSQVLPEKETEDSFENLIKIAHKNNISVHAKLLTFFMYWAPEAQIDKMIKAGRVLINTNGKIHIQANTPWLDPSQIENRKQVHDLIKEILDNYDVDGIQLDYVRFYEEKNVPESILKIRQSIITNFVTETGNLIKKINPSVRYSACIFYNLQKARNQMAQNWDQWIDQKIFSFLVPMNYTTHPEELIKWINRQDHIRRGQITFYSGLGSYMSKMTPEILLKEIDIVRRSETPGFILFSYTKNFKEKMLPALIKNLD